MSLKLWLLTNGTAENDCVLTFRLKGKLTKGLELITKTLLRI